jgi:translation initiation factor 2B subunit (eIF-2B alpha/beta/delta family)
MGIDKEIEELERYIKHLKAQGDASVFIDVAKAQLKILKKQKNADTKNNL